MPHPVALFAIGFGVYKILTQKKKKKQEDETPPTPPPLVSAPPNQDPDALLVQGAIDGIKVLTPVIVAIAGAAIKAALAGGTAGVAGATGTVVPTGAGAVVQTVVTTTISVGAMTVAVVIIVFVIAVIVMITAAEFGRANRLYLNRFRIMINKGFLAKRMYGDELMILQKLNEAIPGLTFTQSEVRDFALDYHLDGDAENFNFQFYRPVVNVTIPPFVNSYTNQPEQEEPATLSGMGSGITTVRPKATSTGASSGNVTAEAAAAQKRAADLASYKLNAKQLITLNRIGWVAYRWQAWQIAEWRSGGATGDYANVTTPIPSSVQTDLMIELWELPYVFEGKAGQHSNIGLPQDMQDQITGLYKLKAFCDAFKLAKYDPLVFVDPSHYNWFFANSLGFPAPYPGSTSAVENDCCKWVMSGGVSCLILKGSYFHQQQSLMVNFAAFRTSDTGAAAISVLDNTEGIVT